MAGLTPPPRWQLPVALWQGEVPLAPLLGRHMLLTGTLLNLLCSAGALALLALGADASWAAALHFAPLPWNALLLGSVWRHPQRRRLVSAVGLAWFMAMLVV